LKTTTPLRSRLVGWYLMLPPLTSPVHHYAWAHRSHDFAAASFFGSAKSRGTVRLIKTSFANYSPMLEWDFVKSGASPGVRGDVKHSAYWWFETID
jgi:hypothetical protein